MVWQFTELEQTALTLKGTCFAGINMKISSRRNSSDELEEMQAFANNASGAMHHLISELFYDSKQSCCVIIIDDRFTLSDFMKDQIIKHGEKHLSQFQLDNVVYHGEKLYNHDTNQS